MIEHETRNTRVNGKVVDLTKIEDKLLTVLMSDYQVKTRGELLTLVWSADPTNQTRTVDMTVSRLKRKLGRDGKNAIKTIHGVGYRFGR